MKNILVTGSEGFLGRNLCVALRRLEGVTVSDYDMQQSFDDLERYVAQADFIFHLAGINRPREEQEFTTGNVDLTRMLCDFAVKQGCRAPILLSSSTQAEKDNAYGKSKRAAEELLIAHSRLTQTPILIYRFPNLFGKWSRPNYNSVISTFCHNISHDLEIKISDPDHLVSFAHVDDVVAECLCQMQRSDLDATQHYYEFREVYPVALGELARLIRAFRAVRNGAPLPDLADPLTRKLYGTYLSYVDRNHFSYSADVKSDRRGWLFELIKSPHGGQIFVSKTYPGITRGNHYHDRKAEKFCVVQGKGIIRFRHILEEHSFAYEVSDENIHIVDIPPGYTHSIENVGDTEMITLFWVTEVFEQKTADTYFEEVGG